MRTSSRGLMISILLWLLSQDRALVSVGLKSSDSYDLDIWKVFSNLLFWHPLIVAERQDIRTVFSDRCEDIVFVAEDHLCIRKVLSYDRLTYTLNMDRISSLTRGYPMISGDHDDEFIRELGRFSEIEGMTRMENIKCSKTHHSFLRVFDRSFCAIFRIKREWHWRRHITKRSQIGEYYCLWTQKVHNF